MSLLDGSIEVRDLPHVEAFSNWKRFLLSQGFDRSRTEFSKWMNIFLHHRYFLHSPLQSSPMKRPSQIPRFSANLSPPIDFFLPRIYHLNRSQSSPRSPSLISEHTNKKFWGKKYNSIDSLHRSAEHNAWTDWRMDIDRWHGYHLSIIIDTRKTHWMD